MESTSASPAPPSVGKGDAPDAIVAEGLCKRYPRKPVTLFPPTVSIFDRGWFGRRKESQEPQPAGQAGDERARASRARRRQEDEGLDDPFGLEEEDELDDDLEEDEAPASGGDPANPGPMFWALKDVSFRLAQGAALGVLGGPDAGKGTLLGILARQVWPTEGRAQVRAPLPLLPETLAKAVSATSKGADRLDLLPACRLLGLDAEPVEERLAEIEELAAPLLTEDGDPAPGALDRLAVAAAVFYPSNVVLIEEPARSDEAFMTAVVERLRDRLRAGSAVVLASRQPAHVLALCDEVMVLHEGEIVDRGAAKRAGRRFEETAAAERRSNGDRASGAIAPGRYLSERRKLRIPASVVAFNSAAAIVSGTLGTETAQTKRIDAAEDELVVELIFETALPDVEAHCGVVLAPRVDVTDGLRLEQAEALHFTAPGRYILVARAPQGTLPGGLYDVRADAIVASPAERGATVIERTIGSIHILGDESYSGQDGAPIRHWDGRTVVPAQSEWSASRAPRNSG